MRIDAFNQVSQIYNTGNNIKTHKTSKTSGKDQVQISSFGKAYQVAKQAVSTSDDIREDKVAALKEQINSGTYEVSGEEFAEKIMSKFDTSI